jgi:hypothetical protein
VGGALHFVFDSKERQFKLLAFDVSLVAKTLVKDVCVALVETTKNVRPICMGVAMVIGPDLWCESGRIVDSISPKIIWRPLLEINLVLVVGLWIKNAKPKLLSDNNPSNVGK